MPSGWAVLCDVQFLRGYTILLSDPVVPDLNALAPEQRAQFLLDMTTIGDALLEVTGAFRINYEILGNLDPALHAHIIPHYMSEPEGLRKGPAFFYDKDFRNSIRFDYERDEELMQQLVVAVRARL
jgi:diadenosine tetraphosphate (Ap4A) HIT family hydrolase